MARLQSLNRGSHRRLRVLCGVASGKQTVSELDIAHFSERNHLQQGHFHSYASLLEGNGKWQQTSRFVYENRVPLNRLMVTREDHHLYMPYWTMVGGLGLDVPCLS